MGMTAFLVNIAVPVSMFVVMTIIGLDLSRDDFRRIGRYPKAILVGTSAQLVTLPLLAAGIILILDMPAADIGALIVFAACPGGGLSNVMTAQARGNVALSVSYTALGSMLGLLTIPLIAGIGFSLLLAEDAAIRVPVLPMIGQLLLFVFMPIMLGMWCRNRYSHGVVTHQPKLNQAANILILVILLMSMNVSDGITLDQLIAAMPAAILFSLGSLLIGLATIKAAGLSRGDGIALLIEFSVRHAGIATIIIMIILQRFDMMALLAACALTQVLVVIALVVLIRRMKPVSTSEYSSAA